MSYSVGGCSSRAASRGFQGLVYDVLGKGPELWQCDPRRGQNLHRVNRN